jgi:hypothetical protein
MKKILFALAATAALAAPPAAAAPPAPAAPPAAGEEVSIPFVHFGGIWNFEAQDDEIVYLQDRGRNWYRARLNGPCLDIGWANAIGVDTRGSPNFDRFSTLIVGHQSCSIESLTRSGPPPKRHHGKKG